MRECREEVGVQDAPGGRQGGSPGSDPGVEGGKAPVGVCQTNCTGAGGSRCYSTVMVDLCVVVFGGGIVEEQQEFHASKPWGVVLSGALPSRVKQLEGAENIVLRLLIRGPTLLPQQACRSGTRPTSHARHSPWPARSSAIEMKMRRYSS